MWCHRVIRQQNDSVIVLLLQNLANKSIKYANTFVFQHGRLHTFGWIGTRIFANNPDIRFEVLGPRVSIERMFRICPQHGCCSLTQIVVGTWLRLVSR